MDTATRRPVERRVTKLLEQGVAVDEIARRFRRSPDHIRRVAQLASVDRPVRDTTADGTLRPLERRLLKWREAGAEPAELAPRFRRSAAHLGRVEELARLKLRRG